MPTLDGVAFIDPKRSQVDIIQAVGRVIRKAEGVGKGTIVIPVFIDESEDEETVLTSSAFKPVWQVIKALRAHDEVLAEELDELRLKLGKRSAYGGKLKLPSSIKVDIPTLVFKDFERAFNVRTVETTTRKPDLTIEKILGWADEHKKRTGKWPNQKFGVVSDVVNETWVAIHTALRIGLRGLPGGSSLARLLEKERDVRNIHNLPDLTIDQILKYVDEHKKRTGKWPVVKSGQLYNVPEENWVSINGYLTQGQRGLAGGSSLAKLLEEKRGVVNEKNLPDLKITQILQWADEHRTRTGKWPVEDSGPVHNVAGEKWGNISNSLFRGRRGLPGGSSLAKLLAEKRGVRNEKNLPVLTEDQILQWADEHHKRTGKWPNKESGPVRDSLGEKWMNISAALFQGQRGLPGGSSLAQLLAEKRRVRNLTRPPQLSIEQIMIWANAHKERTGKWPVANSGEIYNASGEKWANIEGSLNRGRRGLPGGLSLAKLIKKYRK